MAFKKVGIVGYGSLGQYLHKQIKENPLFSGFEIAFIWNRTSSVLDEHEIDNSLRLDGDNIIQGLEAFYKNATADIVIEAAHPDVVKEISELVLDHSDFFITSLTAFAEPSFLDKISVISDSTQTKGQIILPTGAGWGLKDIQRMSVIGNLEELSIEMYFHFEALKVQGKALNQLADYIASDQPEPGLIAEGKIPGIARQAPNNSNTMMSLWLACKQSDRDKVKGKLYAQKDSHTHFVKLKIIRPDGYKVELVRTNPARKGAVTGNMTFSSFASSLLEWGQKGPNGFYII